VSDTINISILGASGFVGAELIKLCLNHPNINISSMSANNQAGQKIKIDKTLELDEKYSLIDEIDFKNVDYVFNCLPNIKLHSLINSLPNNLRIIDLSADFRLDDISEYKNWYGFEHSSSETNEKFVYGLSELKRKDIKNSMNIANPGCYATSVLVPLIPLLEKNMIKNDNIIIDAKSGYSGAGKTKKTEDLKLEVNENIKTYGVGDHKHIAEINQEIKKASKMNNSEVFFSANLIPVERGILSNIYINPSKGVSFEDVYSCLYNAYKSEKYINILNQNEIPITKDVVNTNKVILGLKKGYKEDVYCIVSVLDNLLKGAAGQAMQNFNIMNNFNESLGID